MCALAAEKARGELSAQIEQHTHKAKQARVDEAVATTQVTLSKIITVNAVELLSTFPTDLWKQLHGARKQVCWAYLRGRRLHRHGRILCSRSLCLAAWSIVLHATGLMPPERMQLLRAGRHTSAAVRIEPWIRMLSTQAPAAPTCVVQAVASAHKALSSALSGVALQDEEEEQLAERLQSSADKKLSDLLQVGAVLGRSTLTVICLFVPFCLMVPPAAAGVAAAAAANTTYLPCLLASVS